MSSYASLILDSLQQKQNPDKARWLENYVKHDIHSWGVGIPEIREIIQQVVKETEIQKDSLSSQSEFLNELMQHPYTEPKLAAILYLQLYWKSGFTDQILNLTGFWFDQQWITDWNVCDWLCVRLLTPVLDTHPEKAVSEFKDWNNSPNLWKARASLVPFAQSKTKERHTKVISLFSEVLIKREERFSKTAVGWVMREYSRIDADFVSDFLDQHQSWLTKEVIANATKYIKKAK